MNHSISVIVVLFSFLTSEAQIEVSGKTILDSTYDQMIYVSKIPNLFDIYNSANHLIIDSTKIDVYGNWHLSLEQSDEPVLIRLQVKKKLYPVTSLLIGTQDENFGLVAIDGKSSLEIKNNGKKLIPSFGSKDKLNSILFKIDSITTHWAMLDMESKTQGEKISIRKVAAEELFRIADTAKTALPAIYAAHQANFGFNEEEVQERMKFLRDRFGQHQYLKPYNLDSEHKLNPFVIFTSLLISIFIIYRLYKFYTKDRTERIFDSLSFREKEVFKLVLKGQTNKEISQELNIEPSTVKSHLKNIYSKLNVKSRTELSQFERLLS